MKSTNNDGSNTEDNLIQLVLPLGREIRIAGSLIQIDPLKIHTSVLIIEGKSYPPGKYQINGPLPFLEKIAERNPNKGDRLFINCSRAIDHEHGIDIRIIHGKPHRKKNRMEDTQLKLFQPDTL